MWKLRLFGTLSRRGLNPIKHLVYDPDWSDGRLNLTANTFNQLGQYTSSPGSRGYCYISCPFCSFSVATSIASTHGANPRWDGQAELTLMAGCIAKIASVPDGFPPIPLGPLLTGLDVEQLCYITLHYRFFKVA